MIFRHEFIQLVSLRESGFDDRRYRKRGVKYVPQMCTEGCPKGRSLFFNLQSQTCQYCDSLYTKEIISSIEKEF